MDIKQLTPRDAEIFLKNEFTKNGYLKEESIEESLGGETNAAEFYSYVLKTHSLGRWYKDAGYNLSFIILGHDNPKKRWFNSICNYSLYDSRSDDGPGDLTRLLSAKADRVLQWLAELGFQLVCNNDGTDSANYDRYIGFGILESVVKTDATKEITGSMKNPPKSPKRFVLKYMEGLRRIAEDFQRDPRDIEAAKYLVELLNKT